MSGNSSGGRSNADTRAGAATEEEEGMVASRSGSSSSGVGAAESAEEEEFHDNEDGEAGDDDGEDDDDDDDDDVEDEEEEDDSDDDDEEALSDNDDNAEAEEEEDDADDADDVEDGEEEEDDDDSNDGVICAGDVGSAVIVLQEIADGPRRIRRQKLEVNVGHVPNLGGDTLLYRGSFPRLFRQFVMELERCRGIAQIDLEFGNFCQEGWEAPGRQEGGDGRNDEASEDDFRVDVALQPDERDLDRLFGTVLPHHASLEDVCIRYSRIQPRFLNSFIESFASNPALSLNRLSLHWTPLPAEGGLLLKSMLRSNARVRELSLRLCGLSADGWRLVCEGAAASRHLDLLDLIDDIEVPPGTVVAALGPGSTLSRLRAGPRLWSGRAFAELVVALRTRTVLEEAFLGQVGGFRPAQVGLVSDLLRTYNFTLKDVNLYPATSGEVRALLRRNERVRSAVEHLQASGYRVACRAAWPLALQEIVTFPTLLYRFLRRGNVGALAEQVGVNAPNMKKRSRGPTPPPSEP